MAVCGLLPTGNARTPAGGIAGVDACTCACITGVSTAADCIAKQVCQLSRCVLSRTHLPACSAGDSSCQQHELHEAADSLQTCSHAA